MFLWLPSPLHIKQHMQILEIPEECECVHQGFTIQFIQFKNKLLKDNMNQQLSSSQHAKLPIDIGSKQGKTSSFAVL
ncbi:hypothetical protein DVA76_18730, partial [Acinetobacter baumannii]